MNTYLAKQIHAEIAVQQKSKEVNLNNSNKEDKPRLLKQHGPCTDMASTQHHHNVYSKMNM